MAEHKLVSELLDPASWSDIQVVPEGGLMRKRASFAKAVWLAKNERAFIKVLWPAEPTSGRETRLLVSPREIRDIKDRIDFAGSLSLPLVPMFEVFIHDSDALVMAMKELVPLSDIIARGTARELVAPICEHFDPRQQSAKWCHFDIDPSNIGVDGHQHPWLLDPESLYACHRSTELKVLAKAFKPWRCPQDVIDQLHNSVETEQTLWRKHIFETLLVAAECCLGPADCHGKNCAEEWIDKWLSEHSDHDVAHYWRRILHTAITEKWTSLSDLDLTQLPASKSASNVPQPSTTVTADQPDQFDRCYKLLRNGKLNELQLSSYVDLIDKMLKSAPEPRLYLELVLIQGCYFKDFDAASGAACAGVTAFPDHEELRQWDKRFSLRYSREECNS